MKKGIWLGKGHYLMALLSGLCAIGMTIVIAIVTHYCMIINESCTWFWQDISSDKQSFYETVTFYQMLHNDTNVLANYLAVSTQLETDGKYDENKVINIINYSTRRDVVNNDKFDTNHSIEDYELVDEISSSNDATNPTTDILEIENIDNIESINTEDTLVETETKKNDNKAISAEQLNYRLGDLIQWGSEGVYYIGESDVIEYSDSNKIEYRGEKLKETFSPLNAKSLYDVELPEGMSYDDLADMIVNAARDLNTNYNTYLQYKDYFSENSNLKYMVVNQYNSITYSNLNQVGNKADALIETFKQNDFYLKYNIRENQIETSNIGTSREMEYKRLFHNYAYNFSNDDSLYITLQTKDNKQMGKVNTKDYYATAASNYEYLRNNLIDYMVGAGVLALFTLIFLIMFIIFQPKKKKDELKYFDRWFTEIAAAVALGSAYLVGSLGLLITDGFTDGSDGYQYFMKNSICASFSITIILLYFLFLFFMGSLVRRIKAGTLWSGSMIYFLLKNMKVLLAGIGKVIGVVLNHKLLFVRSFVPYILFLAVNVFNIAAFEEIGLFLDIILDGIVGVFIYMNNIAREDIVKGITKICNGELDYQIPTNKQFGENKIMAEAVNQIGNAVQNAVQISMKDERLKADLITNVSHDIKTPLTSIINYVDLLKREDIQSQKALEYINILDEKSQRLKQLTLDLVEASKISSGNITIDYENLDVAELIKQTIGEYEDKFLSKELQVITGYPNGEGRFIISADSRHMWRIMENLFINIYKYALERTRVYVDIQNQENRVEVVVKNISAQPLNIPADELTQRFIRGDLSRSTEGSGLGLSIAKNLTEAQKGKFEIYLDGDLFKVMISFPASEKEE